MNAANFIQTHPFYNFELKHLFSAFKINNFAYLNKNIFMYTFTRKKSRLHKTDLKNNSLKCDATYTLTMCSLLKLENSSC